jgi:phosphoenolpyruvate carboxylase
VSGMSQLSAYAIGVPPNIYGFHSYTGNSNNLSHPLA